MADDFDSSGVHSDPPHNEFPAAGAVVIRQLAGNAEQLLALAKKDMKEFDGNSSAASTRAQRAAHRQQWELFYTSVLHKRYSRDPVSQIFSCTYLTRGSTHVEPTADDIELYIRTLPRVMKHRMGRAVISVSTVKATLTNTIQGIQERFRTFDLAAGQKLRLRRVIEELQSSGELTMAALREPQWVSCQLMVCLNRALLVNAIKHGTPNWSVVVQKCLGLALQSALSSRCGDITVSGITRLANLDACLKYECVRMWVAPLSDATTENPSLDQVKLRANITLMYTKNKKTDPTRNHQVALESLDDPTLNTGDPLKLLLCHALRLGNVRDATTLHDAIRNAVMRNDRLIVWEHPGRPVLCKATHKRLQPDDPAMVQLLQTALKEAGVLSGITARLATHDLRRGAAREAALLPNRLNVGQAAEALDHVGTETMAVTKKYVGGGKVPNLADRMRLVDTDMFTLNDVRMPNPADASSVGNEPNSGNKKRRRLAEGEVEAYLADPKNAKLLKLKDPAHAASRKLNDMRNHPQEKAKAVDSEEDDVDQDVDQDVMRFSGVEMGQSASHHASNGTPAEDVHESAQRVGEALEELAGEAELHVPQGKRVTTAQTQASVLLSRPSEFVEWLSKINVRVVNDTNPKQHQNLDRGGSKDEPTFFEHHCKFEADGCDHYTTSGPAIRKHEAVCTPESRAASRNGKREPKFQEACDEPSCKYVARADTESAVEKKLRDHRNYAHPSPNTKLIPCPIGDDPSCFPGFENTTKLSYHDQRVHKRIVPQLCPLQGQDDCTSKKVWDRRVNLYDHLRHSHSAKGSVFLSKILKEAEGRTDGNSSASATRAPRPPAKITTYFQRAGAASGIVKNGDTMPVISAEKKRNSSSVNVNLDDGGHENEDDANVLAGRPSARAPKNKRAVIVVDSDEDDETEGDANILAERKPTRGSKNKRAVIVIDSDDE